jgi:hypothetical protein
MSRDGYEVYGQVSHARRGKPAQASAAQPSPYLVKQNKTTKICLRPTGKTGRAMASGRVARSVVRRDEGSDRRGNLHGLNVRS